MKTRFQNMLSEYRKNSFKLYHETKDVRDELLEESKKLAQEILSQKFIYKFHKEPDKDRAEVLNMAYNITTESILPPVLEKAMERVIILEKRHEMLLDMVVEILKILSEDEKDQG